MAEGGALLRRYTGLNRYRGFESLSLRQLSSPMATLRDWARSLKRQTLTLYYATRDPRTPWYAKAVAGLIVAYAISPIDLIPDFIPVPLSRRSHPAAACHRFRAAPHPRTRDRRRARARGNGSGTADESRGSGCYHPHMDLARVLAFRAWA